MEKLKDITLINDQCKHHQESYWPSQFFPTRVLLPGVLANRVRLSLAQKQKQKKFSLWSQDGEVGAQALEYDSEEKPSGAASQAELRRAGWGSRGAGWRALTALQPPSWLEALRGALLRTVHGPHMSRAAVSRNTTVLDARLPHPAPYRQVKLD